MLKIFMGDASADDVAEELKESSVRPDPVPAEVEELQFDPLAVMKKAVSLPSYDGLVVVD